MTYVALALVALLAIETIAFPAALLNMERRHSRRVDMLLDRLAHSQGRTWTPPPASDNSEPEAERSYTHSPEQEIAT